MPDIWSSRSGAEPLGGNGEGVAMEEAIRRRARDFEIGALLGLLRTRFPGRHIRFCSHHASGLCATAVDDVRFERESIIITLNLGLFSSTGALPSYFREWLEGPHPVPGLEAIIGVLNDRLLRDRSEGAIAPRSPRLLSGEAAMRRNLFRLARPASRGTLYWLFDKIYPELGVSVSRSGVHRGFLTAEPTLGQARLGHAAMGGEADVLASGFDVFLSTGESLTWAGEPWPHEARRRLVKSIFPALAETAVHLRVLLFDFEGSARLALVRPSTFGFAPLVQASSPHVVLLHEGKISAN